MSRFGQALVKSRQNMETVLDRRQLETCVFYYLARGLQSGDVYVEGSQTYADYRQQLMPWRQCIPRLAAYCQALQIPDTAEGFVPHLKQRLREVTERVDTTFPDNTELTIDDSGKPHLKRQGAQPTPEDLETLSALLKECMPERHLLDVLKNVHHAIKYTRHFGPPSEPTRNSRTPFHATSGPSLAMPANSGPRKPLATRRNSLADKP